MRDGDRRAKAIASDPALEQALSILQAVGEEGPAGTAEMLLSLATFAAFAALLEQKGVATMEETIEAFVLASGEVARQVGEQRRLAGILGELD